MTADAFENFETFDVTTSATTIHGRHGGSGPPVLLLHGIPETHLMWHRVAPVLAEHRTVVATDLRGFGASGVVDTAPDSASDHALYAMRALALDQVEVMRALGHERFAVVGHDRGARCAYRLALDHPDVVSHLAVLDIVPTAEAFAGADARFALGYWVWTFLAAPYPVPERLIVADPDALVDHMLDTWTSVPEAIPAELREQYAQTFRDPRRVHAICEQYRAAATLDREHDEADRAARRRIACPVLVLWDADGAVAQWYDPLAIWREWADEVLGGPVSAGHFLPEEAPDAVLAELVPFLR